MRPAIKKKKKCIFLPVVQQQTHIRLISWSKPIRDSEDSFTSISKKVLVIPLIAKTIKNGTLCYDSEAIRNQTAKHY